MESDISDPIMTSMIVPSKPGKPRALRVTHDSIKLEWTKPEYGAHNITSYTVLYNCSSSDHFNHEWLEHATTNNAESLLLSQLSENTLYFFKIRPDYKVGSGLESDISDPVETKMILPGKPGKSWTKVITDDCVVLQWDSPEQDAHNISACTVFYRSASGPPDRWNQQRVQASETCFSIVKLSKNTTHYFRVRSNCRDGFGPMSDTSDPITTNPRDSCERDLYLTYV